MIGKKGSRRVKTEMKINIGFDALPGGLRLALSVLCAGALIWVTQGAVLGATDIQDFPEFVGWSLDDLDSIHRERRAASTFSLPRVKSADLNISVTFGRDTVARLARLENSLTGAGVQVHLGSPCHGQLIESMPQSRALDQGRDAMAAVKASLYLSQHHCQRYGIDDRKCAKWLNTMKLTSTPLGHTCFSTTVDTSCKQNEKYRSYDGICNQVVHPTWGQAFSAYRRLLFPEYSDGLYLPRGPLPSARLISSTVATDKNAPDKSVTLAFMQWTQFVEHDFAHTPSAKMVNTGTPLSCCREDGSFHSPRHVHPLCMPIKIPNNDPFYSPHRVQCMSYIRTINAFRPDCTFGTAEQINQATHFLDGSQLYGNSLSKERSLRMYSEGKLLLVSKKNRLFLPPSEHPREHCQVQNDMKICYKSGDVRANMHPHLTAMHTLWAREHNRIATELAVLNSHWDDEKIYQESRRIVIAEMQHITYNHWAPMLLGSRYAQKLRLVSPLNGYTNFYRDNLDPSVSNAFATAGLRFVYSMMQGKVKLFDEHRKTNVTLLLRDHFNKPHVLEDAQGFDSLVRGLATQTIQEIDVFLVEDLTNLLFRDTHTVGLDAMSLDIQRGRDHGLPGYNQFRKFCGLPAAARFEDFLDTMRPDMVQKLRLAYNTPNEVDLIVGGVAETPRDGALVGPTLRCIIGEQLVRSRRTDRYFFDSVSQPYPFTTDQLKEIQKSSLSRVFCDNGDDLNSMQPEVFSVPSLRNPLTPCTNTRDIPEVDLLKWRENFV